MNQFGVILVAVLLAAVGVLGLKLYHYKKQIASCKPMQEVQKWHELAFVDALTGLENRAAYNQHIAELQNGTRPKRGEMGIMLFDIDRFKDINDIHGHLAGDRRLRAAAARLTEVFEKEHYSIYRIGGDEFAVIGENISEQGMIDKMLCLRTQEEDGEIRFSKGYAMISTSFQKAFERADEMMYADKYSKK